MRKFILPFFLLHLSMAVNAATYYFSNNSGDDSRTSAQAQNSSTPWKTLTKLNSIMLTLQPGDQVLFNRGETFMGSMVVTVSGNSSQPITFGAYGTGNNPIISGFSDVMNWVQVCSNVWEAPFWQPNGAESMVIMNNQQQPIGRYPNSNATNGGYLTIDSHVGLTQLTSSQLPSSPNWTGADIAIRKNNWVIDRSQITSQVGTTVNFVSASTNTITDGFGFFIENSTNTLDQNGEWFYDNTRSKMQMYFSGNNPTAYSVKASTVATLVSISFQNYLTFSNLQFIGANSYAFNLTNCSYVKLASCNINYTGNTAIQGLSSNYVTVTGSTIYNSNNEGIGLYWNCNNVVITNDTVRLTSIIPGMGQSGNGAYQGIYMRGNYNLIQKCEVDSSGGNGIHFEGDWSTVTNNFVNTFGFIIDDCGGIYTGQGLGDSTIYNSKSIVNNIVINGIGAPAGTNDTTYLAAVGIYLDDNTNHVAVMGNTTANCAHTGIFNHNATYTNISNNTMYNNGNEQFLAVRSINPVSQVTVLNNIMFAKTASQLVSRMESYYGTNNLAQLGNVNYNAYCRPIDSNYMFYDMYQIGSTYYTSYQTLSSWQSTFGFDANSTGTPGAIPAFTYTSPSGADIYPNGGYNTNIWNVSTFSSINDITSTWLPNKLDSGTLQLSANNYSPSNNFYITLPTNNTVTAGNTYMLTFTLQGALGGSPMTVYLRQQDYPNATITTSTIIPIPANRQNFSFAFTPTMSGRVSVELDVAQPNSAIWLDNVMLQSATITQTNPDNYILFAYNPTSSNMQVPIPISNTYLDATGKKYNGSNTVLKPYTSIVLFQQVTAQTNSFANTDSTQMISLQASLTDASTSTVSSTSSDLTWQVSNQDSDASSYGIERSSDAIANFATIGITSVKRSSDSTIKYQFKDASPLGGKNYYRISQLNEKGVSKISKVVMINNISFKLNPNPARDVVHLMFDQPVNAADHLGKDIIIRNTAGVTVKIIPLPSTDNLNRVDLNVSDLQRGLYIVSLTSDGKAFSKTFVKE